MKITVTAGHGAGDPGAVAADGTTEAALMTELRGSPIEWSDALARAAQAHADDMAAHGFAAHTGSDGSAAPDRAQAQGWPSQYVGENLSAGEAIKDQQTAQASWEHSAAHMKNTLHPGYTHAGLACAASPTGYRMYWVQVLAAASDKGRS